MTRDIRFLLESRYASSRALIIGINAYTHAGPLGYAVHDAEGVENALISDLSFPRDNVITLKDADATRENILRSYAKFIGAGTELDDRIVIFFAGHGHTLRGSRGDVGFLIPVDGNTDDPSTLIRWDELTRYVDLIKAKHMLFIMDACYGGTALTRNVTAGSVRFLKDMMLRYSRQVLTAGKADQTVSDTGGPLPNHSVFTGHLIEGLRGAAHSKDGILTANGLMSYVHSMVGTDQYSTQTPHYGHIDGDGDFILMAPSLDQLGESAEHDVDTLIVVPTSEHLTVEATTPEKAKRIKSLLASETTSIEMHDYLVDEVRRFLLANGEDNFKVHDDYSLKELTDRISKYEESVHDLSVLVSCVAHWAKPEHRSILQKILSRSTDHLDSKSGLTAWLSLRWYPIVIELYCAGIAAVASKRYDVLTDILLAPIGASRVEDEGDGFSYSVNQAMQQLNQMDIFKKLPGHEKHYVPLSEYLFKILQPRLDDSLFLGKSYERHFDEFEVLYGLAIADARKLKDLGVWGPIGRFGWKQRHYTGSPLNRVIGEAKAAGANWAPLKAGMFGGDLARFNEVSTEFSQLTSRLMWH